jgi:hypothetical protein
VIARIGTFAGPVRSLDLAGLLRDPNAEIRLAAMGILSGLRPDPALRRGRVATIEASPGDRETDVRPEEREERASTSKPPSAPTGSGTVPSSTARTSRRSGT